MFHALHQVRAQEEDKEQNAVSQLEHENTITKTIIIDFLGAAEMET